MLLDRRIDFSDTKEKEWKELKSKIGDGIELPLPDSERWFLAATDGDTIKIEGATRNVRPLKVYDPVIITFKEFAAIAEIYNDSLFGGLNVLGPKLELQKTMANFRYIYVLIYNLL
jgi:hypothetical protein